MNINNIFSHFHTLEGVELSRMGLKFRKVLVGFFLFLATVLIIEDYDASGLISKSNKIASWIKFNFSNDILINNPLSWTFVAEYLRILVVGPFTCH